MLRQRTGSTVCPGCGSLVGVNDDTCYNCGRRNPGSLGVRAAAAAAGAGPGLRHVRDRRLGRPVPGDAGGVGTTLWAARDSSRSCLPIRRRSFCLAPAAPFPCSGSAGGGRCCRAGWLHGGLLHILFNMNARAAAAPPVAELYGAGRMMIIYTAGGVRGLHRQLRDGLRRCPACRCWAASQLTIGASAPIFGLLGRARLLRPSQRQLRHAGDGAAERRDHVRDGAVPARHRQLGARRRVRRRLADVEVARPARRASASIT